MEEPRGVQGPTAKRRRRRADDVLVNLACRVPRRLWRAAKVAAVTENVLLRDWVGAVLVEHLAAVQAKAPAEEVAS